TFRSGVHVESAVAGRSVGGEQLAAGQPDVDGDSAAIPVAMPVARQLDHDMTRDDAIEEVFELRRAPLHVRGERVGVSHAAEGELERGLHDRPPSCRDRAWRHLPPAAPPTTHMKTRMLRKSWGPSNQF